MPTARHRFSLGTLGTLQWQGSMTTSFFGFRGGEDLGDGLAAYFVPESYMRPDTGESGRFGGDPFLTRNAYLGLSSASWDSIELGRNTTPLFVTTLRFNAFGPSIGFFAQHAPLGFRRGGHHHRRHQLERLGSIQQPEVRGNECPQDNVARV
jgi:predicted porin